MTHLSNLLKATTIATVLSLSANIEAKQIKDFSASLSPDESQLVVYSYRDDALPNIYRMEIDGSHETALTDTDDQWNIEPAWSPVKNQIAFSRGPSMNHLEIYIMNSDGSHLKQLTDSEVSNSGVSWSHDGKSILFNRWSSSNESNIIKMDIRTGKEEILTKSIDLAAFKPTFSPDGKTIAFTASEGQGKTSDMFFMDADGSNIRKLAETDLDESMLLFSRDGKNLFFNAKIKDGNAALFVADLDGSNIKKISNDDYDQFYFAKQSKHNNNMYFSYGDWNSNFFIHKAEYNGHQLQPVQVSGLTYLAAQQQLLEDYLAPFVGTWVGTSTMGRTKGFLEESTYSWGPDKTSLNIEMAFSWGGEPMGGGRGYMALDRDNLKTYFNLVMDDGTVVMQQQSNQGDSKTIKMNVVSSGDGSRFPKEFRTELVKVDHDNWYSKILKETNGEWKITSKHEFKRKKQPLASN